MRAKLRALVRIEPALEKISHDAGLDELPVGLASDRELADFIFGQLEHARVFEKVTIEMANLVRAERAPFRHRLKQIFQDFGEVRGVIDAGLENVGHDIVGKQAGVFGEETKDDAIEETRDAQILALRYGELAAGTRIDQLDRLTLLQRASDFADLLCEFFGDFVGRALRLEEFRIGENRSKKMQDVWIVDLGVRELVRFLDGAVEIGAHDVAIEVANHEQRRIEERFAITQELLVSGIEVFLLAFVLPRETAAFPNIGEATLPITIGFLGNPSRVLHCKEFFILNDAFLKTK